jgi:hypothetical protein
VTRARTTNGVRHAKRCCCPLCDPEGKLLERARDEARAARRFAKLNPLPALALDRPRRPLHLAPFETEKTKRFRELLRSGLSGPAAAAQLESELKGPTP